MICMAGGSACGSRARLACCPLRPDEPGVGGGVAAAFISGFPGVILPLVVAGEVFYLASMLTNERFRSAVEAQGAKSRRAAEAVGAREAYERIRKRLPRPLLAPCRPEGTSRLPDSPRRSWWRSRRS
jgi:hypothetical protein